MKKGTVSVISTAIGVLAGVVAAGTAIFTIKEKEVKRQAERANKNAMVIDALARWITLKQDGKSVTTFFQKNNYRTIAIYGIHYIGERLYRELTEAGIEVKYAIDEKRNKADVDVPVKKLTDTLEDVDAIVVTPVYYFNSIEDKLIEVFDCPIIAFDEILDELSAQTEEDQIYIDEKE